VTNASPRTFVVECDVCHQPAGPGTYLCASCDVLSVDPQQTSYAATRWARLGAFALDYLIIWLTVGIGWLLWLENLAPQGQSPGKLLLGLRIVRTDARSIGAGHLWLRDFGWDAALGLVAVVLLALLGAVASLAGEFLILWFSLTVLFWAFSLFDAAWLLWDRDRQTLHIRVLGTPVVECAQEPG